MKFLKLYFPLILICLFVQAACSQNEKSVIDATEKSFQFAEQMPEFPDGQAAMMKFIQNNLKYPEEARKANTQGTVVLQFVVTETGKIADIKVARGIGHGCDEEAVRVVSIMPAWRPGKLNQKNIPVNFTLPIKFRL